ncbi:type IV secretion system DNA-binding domain-containing protein [Candidatus Kaiserbacteria bacterium]|nr:type IV secretion system DNA-binding domain-containing protein [Candidatus Kaiserbacteria bacterium]
MTAFDPEKITFFAKTDARGGGATFGIKAKDRQRHMYVVGKTGMGKSTLLENMAAQDIMNGEGMAFIDPHGSAAETLLEYVPEHRVQDVVYFAPFDMDHPVSFNVMEDVGPDKRHLVVSGLMSTFKKIWVDAWSARMEYILTNALLVLIEYPDTTLLSVNRLFSDKAYRQKVVDYCQDPAVKSFWVDEFANYTERFAAEALPSIQNKIGQFTGNPLIRNIIGQPHSSFDIRQLMDEKKILIMNLSKGLIGETNANLLGSMLTTRIYLAAMSRANLAVEQMKQMPNFYFYVDEFQSFANATFADILSEARKYHLNLIIAHQYIEQMEEEVRNAVFGNVGTTIAFRVGPFDAEVLETVFAPRFEATDLVNLGFAQIYLTLMIDGIGSQPFSAVTLPSIHRPPVSYRNMVIDSSRKLYASRRESVEQVVKELHTPQRPPEKPKKSQDQSKRPNQNGQSRVNKSNDAKPQFTDRPKNEQRSKPPEKSAEDLRNILAQIAGQNKTDKKSATTETEDRSLNEQPILVTNTNERRNFKNNRPKAVDRNGSAKLIQPNKQKHPREDRQKNTGNPAPKGDLKQALAEALRGVAGEEVISGQTSEAVKQTLPPVQKTETQMPSNNEKTTKSTVAQPLSSTHVVINSQSSSVDTAAIKRMLKQSDNERSPFN